MRNPRRLLAVVAAALLAVAVRAAVPGMINYQGRLTDNSPQPAPIDATVSIEFSIWDAASGGTSLWSETQSVSVAGGLFDVLLGSSTPIPATVFTSGATRYLEIHVSGETLAPRQQIAATPFSSAAAHADDSVTLGGLGAAAFQQRIASPCPAGYAISAVAADGTATCIQGPQGPPGPPGPPGPGQDLGAISGSVITCSGPISRTHVYVPGRTASAYTASDGSYLLTGLPSGTYEVDIPYTSDPTPYRAVTNVIVTNGQVTSAGAYNFTDLNTDSNNCGACGNVCPSSCEQHCTTVCGSGTCRARCIPGYADCNNNPSLTDGCETDLRTSPTNCGACGFVCPGLAIHMTPTCTDGVCGGTCVAGYMDCNHNAADGCEQDIFNDPNNCGFCNTYCAPNHITRVCSQGSCQAGICDAGYGDCNGDKFVDGCEVNLNTSPGNCGSCGHACGGGTPNCSGGVCVP